MSFFPTPDPEKLYPSMVQDHTFHYINATPSPSQHSTNDDDACSDRSAWSTAPTPAHDPYSTAQSMIWPSQIRSLPLDSLPTPTQSMFDQAYQASHTYGTVSSWMPTSSTDSSSGAFASFTTQGGVLLPSFSFATPLATTTAWDSIQSTAPSFVPSSYDSPPAQSHYSASSHHSHVESSPYTHSDGSLQNEGTPYIKAEDTTDYQRPRLYSVPGAASFTPPSHVNMEDVHKSPPLVKSEQCSDEPIETTAKVESGNVRHSLRPQRTHTRRTGFEDLVADTRPKRGFTTPANSTCHCHLCGKLFQRSYNLKAHMETHNSQREQPHACPYASCKQRFVRRTDLVRHEQSVHLKERNYHCPLCRNSFARKDTLRRHIGDGCPRRPEVKKRIEQPRYPQGLSTASGRSSLQPVRPNIRPEGEYSTVTAYPAEPTSCAEEHHSVSNPVFSFRAAERTGLRTQREE